MDSSVVKQIQQIYGSALQGDTEAIGYIVIAIVSIAVLVVFLLNLLILKPKSTHNGLALPPSYSEGIPFIGNLIKFAKDPMAIVINAHREHGELFTIPILNKRLTFVVGADAHEVFCRGTDEELDQTEVYKFSVPVFGKGVVYDVPLDIRYQQYRWLSQGLRVDKLKSYVPMMVMEIEQYFGLLPNEGEMELFETLSQLIVLTSSRCLLGREAREQMFSRLSYLIHDLDQGMQPISVFAPYLPIEAHRKRDAAHIEMKAIFNKVIENRKKTGAKEPDLLQTFIDGVYKDGTPLKNDEIIGLLIAGLFAGQHTSSITSTWTGLHILTDKKWLDKVSKEQEQIRGQMGDEINFEVLNKMDNLHNCMKETLRLHPPLMFLIRYVLKEMQFKDMVIPEGDYMFLSPTLSGLEAKTFTNPQKWDPERFEAHRAEDKKAPFAYVGFGGGRHGCMGEQFAYLQVKAIWTVLFRNFDLEFVAKKFPLPQQDALVVGPTPPCTVRYRRKHPK